MLGLIKDLDVRRGTDYHDSNPASLVHARPAALTTRRTCGYGSSQSSTVSPSTRENSRVLFVAGINSA